MTIEKNTLHILLVDDDAEYVDVIKHQLKPFQNRHFEITCVADGEKALAMLEAGTSFDLLLMDYFLQRTTGVEIAKKIAAKNIHIPIILLTSNKDFHVAIEAMKYGVREYLIKEETVESILPRTIINVIELRQLNDSIVTAEKQKLFSQKTAETVQELIVTMCHEFNNPLAAIKISTDIILRQPLSDEQRAILNKLSTNITQLEKQIVRLRDLPAEPSPSGSVS
jgi:two-component system aerobic respiration control sensor histidine kinase ArcB